MELIPYIMVDLLLKQRNLSCYSLIFSLPFTAPSPQHTEDSSEIQELTKYKPHVLLNQENTQIKELQQENKGKNKNTQFCWLCD